tara:strand:- start:422 stop:745 length:324 start_codon:yes stop_codon:yes gene_type:complete
MGKNEDQKDGYSSNFTADKQISNDLQKVVARAAKHLNLQYVNAINHYSSNRPGIAIEFLQQKVLKQAEQKMSRSNYLKIIDHVNSLEGVNKKKFLEQLQRQFKHVSK